jgi:hypothetical protein
MSSITTQRSSSHVTRCCNAAAKEDDRVMITTSTPSKARKERRGSKIRRVALEGQHPHLHRFQPQEWSEDGSEKNIEGEREKYHCVFPIPTDSSIAKHISSIEGLLPSCLPRIPIKIVRLYSNNTITI